MDTDLGRRLHDLALDAPPSLPADGLWDRGVRRHRSRRLAGAVGALAVLAAVLGGLQIVGELRDDGPLPAGPPTGTGHLPRTIQEPSAWSKGTADEGPLGPLAVLGSADRKRAQGLTGMVTYESIYGISAVDGTARFLDLPSGPTNMPGSWALASLSPDGRKVGYPLREQTQSEDGTLLGWAVYDTVTGKVRELRDPDLPVIASSAADMVVFSGDSRYLLTSYAAAEDAGDLVGSFVAWDVETGERLILEEPGQDWLPNIGSGPDGPVWSRDKETFTGVARLGPPRPRVLTEHDQVMASFAPTGRGFAYIGGTMTEEGIEAPWQFYAGPTWRDQRQVADVPDPGRILGWRDATHVVVSLTDRDYAIVDINDGSQVRGSFKGSINLALPMLAADLWANDLVAGVQPPEAGDPRRRWLLIAGLLGGASLVGAGAVSWWRRRV